jgi:hypothetical protein
MSTVGSERDRVKAVSICFSETHLMVLLEDGRDVTAPLWYTHRT